MNETLLSFEIFGLPALFTDMPRAFLPSTPSQLYRYDLRHGDDDCRPCTIERHVSVNRWGTVYVAEPLLVDGKHSRSVEEDDWSFCYEADDLTLYEFMQKHSLHH